VIFYLLLLSAICLAIAVIYDIKILAVIGGVILFLVTPVGIFLLLKAANYKK